MDASSIKKRNSKEMKKIKQRGWSWGVGRRARTYCLNGKLSNLGFSRDEGKFEILRAGFPLLPYCREGLGGPCF